MNLTVLFCFPITDHGKKLKCQCILSTHVTRKGLEACSKNIEKKKKRKKKRENEEIKKKRSAGQLLLSTKVDPQCIVIVDT